MARARESADADIEYCTELVRRFDGERFLACLFAPEFRRPALMTLHAFNLEVAKTREVVREPMAGAIRLQWWRDAIDEIYAGKPPRRHQVVQPLAAAVRAHALPREPFDRLLDAREADLGDEVFPDRTALEAYADDTSATLTALALRTLGADDDAALAAGRHVGIAWALAGLLRAVPFHARARRVYLPRDVATESGLDLDDLLELRRPEGLPRAVGRVVAMAEDHLDAARRRGRDADPAALPALLPAVLARHHLGRLRRAGCDPFAPSLARPIGSRVPRLLWARATGRI